MQNLQALLDAVKDDTLGVRPGTAVQSALWTVELLSAAGPGRPDAAYLLSEESLAGLPAGGLPAAVYFVACAGDAVPDIPAAIPGEAAVVFVRSELLPLYDRLNRCMDTLRVRNRIDDIFLMAENAQFSPEQLVIALSQLLLIGTFLLNGSYQFICGAAAQFSGSPYSEELARDGVLSYDSVRAIRSGSRNATLYEAASSPWARFNILLLWREGTRLDTQHLCRRLADYVIAYRSRNISPDVPPFLIDQRLSRILEGKTSDETEIASFFDLSEPSWFAVMILGYEPGVRQSAEAYQRQAYLLRAAFRNISITIVHAQICAVVQLPIRTTQDAVFSRGYFDGRAFRDGWDQARLEQELQQCGAYLCSSPIFQTPRFFHIEHELVTDALDIAIRLEGCRGRRIVDFHDYSDYVSIKYAVERYLQKHGQHSIRAVLYPELVTLLLYDLKNGTDLAEVLYRYYTYGDVNHTAQSLFVHRNTVYNKLKAIQNLLHVDLDDPAVRASYLMSLRVYYYCEKCLGLDMHTQE